MDDSGVQQAMENIWNKSYGSTESGLDHNQRNEAMFMVLATTSGYKIEAIPAGPETSSCHFDGGRYDIPSNIVALIHTHPYSDGDSINDPRCRSAEANNNEVSSRDSKIIRQINNSTVLPPTPMYVMDKEKIRIIQPSNPSKYSLAINRCGY